MNYDDELQQCFDDLELSCDQIAIRQLEQHIRLNRLDGSDDPEPRAHRANQCHDDLPF